MKIVINSCYGGFGLSLKAVMHYANLKGIQLYPYMSDYADGKIRMRSLLTCTEEEIEKAIIVHYSKVKDLVDGTIPNSNYFSERDISRDDPDLIKTVETLGDKANGRCSKLRIIKIPDNIDWEIDEYDGMESVEEKHRIWS